MCGGRGHGHTPMNYGGWLANCGNLGHLSRNCPDKINNVVKSEIMKVIAEATHRKDFQ